jgi:hypothetical protein
MSSEYTDKSQDIIATDIKNERDRIGIRGKTDRIEIAQATKNILAKYKKEVESTGISDSQVLVAFVDLENDLTKYIN